MTTACSIEGCNFEGHKDVQPAHLGESHYQVWKLYVCWCGYYTTALARMLSHSTAHAQRGESRPEGEPLPKPDFQGRVG